MANSLQWSQCANSHRLDVYGGAFDIANGWLPHNFNSQIRWWPLLARRIVISDGYFHCYGPLYEYLKLSDLDNHVGPNNPILALLQQGIITPAIRGPESEPTIYRNWREARYGVEPGYGLTLERRDGEEYLRKLDATKGVRDVSGTSS